jgi:hypothetical protein
MWWSRVVSRPVNAAVFAVLACAGFALTLYIAAPGFMAMDSGDQLEQARKFAFRDDHPVALALIWHYTDRVIPGPLGLMILIAGLYWGGLAAIFAVLPGALLPRVIGFLIIALHPPSFSNLPAVWKDTLMQGALVAAIPFLLPGGSRFRAVRYCLAMVLLVLGIGARHNAAAAVWPLLAMPLVAHPSLRALRVGWRWLVGSTVAVIVTLGLTIGLGKTLAPLSQRTEFWQTVPVFDLAGMSIASGELLVEPESGVLTPGMGVREIRYKYHPQWMNSLYYCLPFAGKRCVPLFRRVFDPERLSHLTRNWWTAIAAHPGAYLAHRSKVSRGVLAITGGAPGIYYADRERPYTHFARDYPPPKRVFRLMAWLDRQVQTFWFRPWLYLGLCTALLPIAFLRHARGGSALPVAVALSGLSYMLGVLVSAGSSDYRYSVWMILCSMLCWTTIVLDLYANTKRAEANGLGPVHPSEASPTATAAGSRAVHGVGSPSSPSSAPRAPSEVPCP